jgi:HAD superfamily hydrolase (TIGR01456 family)
MGSRAVAVALDIDGVILRGGSLISGAKDAVQLLAREKIPFIFVSNGGGIREELKADQLSAKLNVHIRKEQIILCHTPFSSLALKYGHQNVLVLGQETCLDVARSYGYKYLFRPDDFFHHNHHILPTRKNNRTFDGKSKPEVQAAMIFHDPVDWSLDMQVLSDVLTKTTPGRNTVQRIPLYACNMDLVYNNEYHLPRYTQGAFLEAFQHLFQTYHQIPLQVTKYGKPFRIQYEFAEKMLQLEAQRLHNRLGSDIRFYGIGDNPHSDIQGANSAGDHWESMLVRTGLFQSELENHDEHPADHVFDTVKEAVEHIILSSK